MCQSQIYDLLKKRKNWIGIDELMDIIKLSRDAINTSLRQMIKFNEIKKKEVREFKEVERFGRKYKITYLKRYYNV